MEGLALAAVLPVWQSAAPPLSVAILAGLGVILLLVLLAACLGAAGVFWLSRYLPRQAEQAFGSPSSALSAGHESSYSARKLS